MRRRTVIPLLIVVAVLAALGLALYLRSNAPPEAARLLPESDAIVYVKLKSIRSATHFDQAAIQRSPSFQHFIDATGIVPERDIDSVAFALHRMPAPFGPNGPVAYSEVFIGHFDGARLAAYLNAIATSRQTYAGHIIYTIPIDGRQLRITQLAYDTVAASNMPTPEQIHSMLDRFRASALSTSGSSLLAARYHDVPLLSEAWGIGRIGLPFAENGFISFLGLQLPLPADTDLVASLRYTAAARVLSGGAVHLRIEEIAPNPRAATRTADTLTTILDIIRGIGNEQQPHDEAALAMRSVINSITLTHHEDHAILNATASIDQLKALTTAHNPTASPNDPADPTDAEPADDPSPN
ncbi:MAG: hypothetical protein HIU91_15630 [Acidobacteria bacterium]|nr:hypothetical protein [Acidobacteriota bacterium]